MMKQIMDGLVFMHKNRIIHRDIKSENILVSIQGVLKFADFGLARDLVQPMNAEQAMKMQPPSYTKIVVTPYYRPPENCLQTRHYDEKVDVWSTACVFAELLIKRPLFRGNSELD
jgi:serine/threonine protein kinase